MEVTLIDSMGDDLTVVNAARVSFNKESHYEIEGDTKGDEWSFRLSEGDEKLIKYLAKNGHWTPFSHPQITLRIKAPIFVRTQLFKHKVGFTENEVSRRYVDDEPEFFYPPAWRGRPTDGAKQGSSDSTVHILRAQGFNEQSVDDAYTKFLSYAEDLYRDMLSVGIAPEQARIILPQSAYTEWYWSFSLAAGCRMLKQRLDPHAQAETRELAQKIAAIIEPLFPVSYKALMNA